MLTLLLVACGRPSTADGPRHAVAVAQAAPATLEGVPARIVAVGDLHADVPAALEAFRLAGVVDAEGRWSGGETWLVQTGDVTDRGPDSRGVLTLLRRLRTEAEAVGGRVVPLLGNHEAMNVQGDWRYVSPEDLAGYGGAEARRTAFSADGTDGAYLRTLDAVGLVGDTVFAHGGVSAVFAAHGIDALNRAARAALDGPDPLGVLGPDGPLWNRAYLLADPTVACAELSDALARLGARRMVVGHTTQRDGRIASRCEGRLHAIDTGISAHYGGHLSALEIRGDVVTPIAP
jgi:hypothetical protein